MALHSVQSLTFWLVMAGIISAWVFNVAWLQAADTLKKWLAWPYKLMLNKYGFDEFNQVVLVDGTCELGETLYEVGDLKMIDGCVNGSGSLTRGFSRFARRIQTGYLNHYTLVMVIGLTCLLVWYLLG